MARRVQIRLRRRDDRCYVVHVSRRNGYETRDNPIARVCRRQDGRWSHTYPESPHTETGSYKTKERAAGAAYRSWKSWIGIP